jgi:hypothetical protein
MLFVDYFPRLNEGSKSIKVKSERSTPRALDIAGAQPLRSVRNRPQEGGSGKRRYEEPVVKPEAEISFMNRILMCALATAIFALPLAAGPVDFSVFTQAYMGSFWIPGSHSSIGNPSCIETDSFTPSPLRTSMGATCDGVLGFSGAASSAAEIGSLHGLVSLVGVQSNAGLSTATAIASFSDTLIIPGSGDFDRIVFHMSLTGVYAGSPLPAGAGRIRVFAAGPFDSFDRIVSSSPAGLVAPVDGSVSFDLPLVMRTGTINPNSFLLEMDAIAEVRPQGGSMTADFSDTLRITGVDLFDSRGNPIDVPGLTSASGFNYSSATPVPEPSTFIPIAQMAASLITARVLARMRWCWGSLRLPPASLLLQSPCLGILYEMDTRERHRCGGGWRIQVGYDRASGAPPLDLEGEWLMTLIVEHERLSKPASLFESFGR